MLPIKISLSVFLLTAFCGSAFARPEKRATFHEDKVLSVFPENEDQLAALKDLMHDDDLLLDFWLEPMSVGTEVAFRVNAAALKTVDDKLQAAGIKATEAIENVQDAVHFQEMSNVAAAFSTRGSVVGRYARFNEISAWIDQMIASHSDIAAPFSAGKSYEGRPLKGLKIGKSAPGKPALWFHAGIHAREWVAVASCIYIIDQLLNNKANRPLTEDLVWYIVPVLNPDGYEYTFTGDRMWRKTRKPYPGNRCPGADPNRNWDSAFGTTGVSRNPCSDTYPGPHAFSESNTRSTSQTIMSLRSELKGFVSFHSFSQIWMMPWGYTRRVTDDYQELLTVAKEAARRVMQTHNTYWRVGPPSHVLYEASGGSFDWVKASTGIKYCYTLECRPDSPRPGFLLPASGIIPSGEETWAGVKYIAKFLIDKYGKSSGGGGGGTGGGGSGGGGTGGGGTGGGGSGSGAGMKACTSAGKLVAHESDCSKYYICTGVGRGIAGQCAGGLKFNKKTGNCDWAANVQC